MTDKLSRKERSARAEQKVKAMEVCISNICDSCVKHCSGVSALTLTLDRFISVQEQIMPYEKHLVRRALLMAHSKIVASKADMVARIERRQAKAQAIANKLKKAV